MFREFSILCENQVQTSGSVMYQNTQNFAKFAQRLQSLPNCSPFCPRRRPCNQISLLFAQTLGFQTKIIPFSITKRHFSCFCLKGGLFLQFVCIIWSFAFPVSSLAIHQALANRKLRSMRHICHFFKASQKLCFFVVLEEGKGG